MKKIFQAILTTVAVLAAVAAAAYAVIRYKDQISAFLKEHCPCCRSSAKADAFTDYAE